MRKPDRQRFTYGAQFSPDKTPLAALLQVCAEHQDDRASLQQAVQTSFFAAHGNSAVRLAGNCLLSLQAYGAIQLTDRGRKFTVTDTGQELLAVVGDEAALHRAFAIHILVNLGGLFLVRLIENMRARGEQVTVEAIGQEMNDLDIEIPPNSTYVSTMRGWLAQAGVFPASGYSVNWDVIDNLLEIDTDTISKLYHLTVEQKYFLLGMARLNAVDFVPSNSVAHYARNIYRVRITTKSLVKDVLDPLVAVGLIESRKTTTGRGAKPHGVKLTEKGQAELLAPLLESLAKITDLQAADINRSFEDVVAELTDQDKNRRGVALELLAVWIIRLLGLRFCKWRLRSFQATGGGEVDVIAASDKIVYSRWQIQCKNLQHKTDQGQVVKGKVDVDTVAKEVGLTFLTNADVVMIITTGTFTGAAADYANQVTDNSRYYVILLQDEDIERIVDDRASIVDILNVKARRVFAKKELGSTEFGVEARAAASTPTETEIGDEIAGEAAALFGAEQEPGE